MIASFLAQLDTLIAFEEDHFAYGPPWEAVKSAYNDNSFYHIEMFSTVSSIDSARGSRIVPAAARTNSVAQYVEAPSTRHASLAGRPMGPADHRSDQAS